MSFCAADTNQPTNPTIKAMEARSKMCSRLQDHVDHWSIPFVCCGDGATEVGRVSSVRPTRTSRPSSDRSGRKWREVARVRNPRPKKLEGKWKWKANDLGIFQGP